MYDSTERRRRARALALSSTLALLVAGALAAEGSGEEAREPDEVYAREVYPVLERYCLSCHPSASLRLRL